MALVYVLIPLNSSLYCLHLLTIAEHCVCDVTMLSCTQVLALQVPSDHLGVMRAIETWVRVCSLDLESNALVKREMRDFLSKMASLGPEYKIWSLTMGDFLKLEVCWSP